MYLMWDLTFSQFINCNLEFKSLKIWNIYIILHQAPDDITVFRLLQLILLTIMMNSYLLWNIVSMLLGCILLFSSSYSLLWDMDVSNLMMFKQFICFYFC